jgi:hypothetical protein
MYREATAGKRLFGFLEVFEVLPAWKGSKREW